MVDTDITLVKYIKKEVDKGFNEEKIRNALLEAGYKQEEIDSAYDIFKETAVETPVEKTIEEEHFKGHKQVFKRIIIINAIILSLIIVGVALFFFPSFTTIDTRLMNNTDAFSFCKGISTSDWGECQKVSAPSHQDNCIYYVSQNYIYDNPISTVCFANTDPAYKSICLMTINENTKNCRRHCDVVKANIKEDYKLCPENKTYCKNSLMLWEALNNKDTTLCSQFKYHEHKTSCHALVSGNTSKCDVFKPSISVTKS